MDCQFATIRKTENVRPYGERWHFFWHTIKEREQGSKEDCDGKSASNI
jgi:hypothetical protein